MDSRLQKSTQRVLVKTAKKRESKKNTLKTQQKQSPGAKRREALINFNHAWMTGGKKRTALNGPYSPKGKMAAAYPPVV